LNQISLRKEAILFFGDTIPLFFGSLSDPKPVLGDHLGWNFKNLGKGGKNEEFSRRKTGTSGSMEKPKDTCLPVNLHPAELRDRMVLWNLCSIFAEPRDESISGDPDQRGLHGGGYPV